MDQWRSGIHLNARSASLCSLVMNVARFQVMTWSRRTTSFIKSGSSNAAVNHKFNCPLDKRRVSRYCTLQDIQMNQNIPLPTPNYHIPFCTLEAFPEIEYYWCSKLRRPRWSLESSPSIVVRLALGSLTAILYISPLVIAEYVSAVTN